MEREEAVRNLKAKMSWLGGVMIQGETSGRQTGENLEVSEN
ncbi:hypothetical protein NY78_0183 [Desulfovibrio sp. TomC]|nr:hypothetical protein NY78_0183 [Desulfovibrio sp. TomC]